ncbi:secretin N-terminal domain-containing protein, partial [Halorhodospira neutriphila]
VASRARRGAGLPAAGLLLAAAALGAEAREGPTDPFHGALERLRGEPEAPAEEAAEPETQMRSLRLTHADAEAVAQLLTDGSGWLDEAGDAAVDPRTNTLILHGPSARLEAAAELARELDRPVPQVMIEARIVLASGDYSRELGSRLDLRSVDDERFRLRAATFADGDSGPDDGLMPDLPQLGDGGRLGIAIGKIGEQLLQLELSAMEAEGRGRVVSSPRVVTAERQEARIEQGVQIPYQETAESGGTAVAFRNAALSLTAVPIVTEEETVVLELRVTKDAVGQVFNGVPSIDTQSVATQLRVGAGETVVLGGVREHEHRERERRVPWLARLPLIGWLFRRHEEQRSRQELLIFVTPRLLERGQ